LQDHSPRNHGKEEQQRQNAAGDPTGLFQNTAEIGGEGSDQKKRDDNPSVEQNCWTQKN
jgi:hypothetical protein